jgi:hypothetical protein
MKMGKKKILRTVLFFIESPFYPDGLWKWGFTASNKKLTHHLKTPHTINMQAQDLMEKKWSVNKKAIFRFSLSKDPITGSSPKIPPPP